MNTAARSRARERLAAGRAALDELVRTRPEPQFVELLSRLDEALEKLESGDWGVCSVCEEVISEVAMTDHPLVSICLECMSKEQRDTLEHDLRSAAQVQRALLPPNPLQHHGWKVAYIWEPFGVVSGDHVDVVRPASGADPLHLLLGDVAGKGLAASLLQSQLHALFRAMAPMQISLSDLLGRANQLFFEATAPGAFATLTATRLYPDGRAVIANAGHPRPLLADRRGVRPIEDASIPLGTVDYAAYTEREIQLDSGDTLLLYTDGLTEAWGGRDEYGVGRAAAALRRARAMPLDELLEFCRKDVANFVNGTPRRDDLTMVAVRRV